MSDQARKIAIEKNIANLIIPSDGEILEIQLIFLEEKK